MKLKDTQLQFLKDALLILSYHSIYANFMFYNLLDVQYTVVVSSGHRGELGM